MMPPKTLAEARKIRYGRSGINPQGTPYRAGFCVAHVAERGRAINFYQCRRKASVGLHCKQHDPDAVKRRAIARSEGDEPAAQMLDRQAEIEERMGADSIIVSRATEPACDHRMRPNGKVICDCFIGALLAVLTNEGLVDGLDEADAIAAVVHDVDNWLASQRIAADRIPLIETPPCACELSYGLDPDITTHQPRFCEERRGNSYRRIYADGAEPPDLLAAIPMPPEPPTDERIEWLNRWPRYCRSCEGWGFHSMSQSVPYGSTSASFDVQDSCDQCTSYGRCARCGENGLTNEASGDDETGNGPCKMCGWNYDDGLPPESEIETEPTT